MELDIIVGNEKETIDLGEKIGNLLSPNSLITLSGDLGAGKTTFTKGIGKALGVKRIINSPTFSILKQYTGDINLSHFDAYRLENQDIDLGFEEILDSDDICVIEWANYIEEILPKERLVINIRIIEDEKRIFHLTSIGDKYDKIVEGLL